MYTTKIGNCIYFKACNIVYIIIYSSIDGNDNTIYTS